MPDRRTVAAVFAGGAVGTLARAVVSTAFPAPAAQWPWPTFVVNVAGAFLLGWFGTRLPPSSLRRPLLGTGLCGGLTTFSTMQLEILTMLEGRHLGLALGYTAASLAAGCAAVQVATGLARRGHG